MLKLLLGVIVGGMIGFLICAVLSINNSEEDRELPSLVSKEIGENDARNKQL